MVSLTLAKIVNIETCLRLDMGSNLVKTALAWLAIRALWSAHSLSYSKDVGSNLVTVHTTRIYQEI